MASKIFGDLANYANLKDPEIWGGHTNSLFPASRRRTRSRCLSTRSRARTNTQGVQFSDGTPAEIMLSHSKATILESLTQPPDGTDPEDFDGECCLNFINILVCMGDTPTPRCQRDGCEESVMQLASMSCDDRRNEVYVQVLKQLSRNPSPRAMELGWCLLLRLCQEAPPEGVLAEFVRAFINKSMAQLVPTYSWANSVTQQCIVALEEKDKEVNEDKSYSIFACLGQVYPCFGR